MPSTVAEFLKQAAAGKFEPGYLLAGNELFFRDKFREGVVKFFLAGKREDLAEHDLAQEPVRDALDDAASLGLFAGRRVVWCRNAEGLLPRRRAAAVADDDNGGTAVQTAGRHSPEAIADYFKRPVQSSIVVFEAVSLDLGDRDDLGRVERLEKLLPVTSVRLDHPATNDAARWLRDEAGRHGFRLADDAGRDLVESCAGDLARAAMELEKLMVYAAGRGQICAGDVELLVSSESTFTLWEISDAIGDRDTARALRLVQDMLRQSTPPLLVTSLIAGQVRKLLKCKEGSKEWVHPKVQAQARKFSVPELKRALEKLFEADVALRSSPPEEKIVIERLVMELAKKA